MEVWPPLDTLCPPRLRHIQPLTTTPSAVLKRLLTAFTRAYVIKLMAAKAALVESFAVSTANSMTSRFSKEVDDGDCDSRYSHCVEPIPTTYRTCLRCIVREEQHVSLYYNFDRAQFEAAQTEVLRQKREYAQALQELQEQVADVKTAVWKLEALYHTIQCKFPDSTPDSSSVSSAGSVFHDDIVTRIPAVLKVLCPTAPEPSSSFKPQLLEQFLPAVPSEESPGPKRCSGSVMLAAPKDAPPEPRYLLLSGHLLHVCPSKEAYYMHKDQRQTINVRGLVVNAAQDFVLDLYGAVLVGPEPSLRLRFESGEQWEQWARRLKQAAGKGRLEVWENERWFPLMGWTKGRMPGDPPPYSDRHGCLKQPMEDLDGLVQASGYSWCNDWAVVEGEDYGEGGWQYGAARGGPHRPEPRTTDVVRRRCWVRQCAPDDGGLA